MKVKNLVYFRSFIKKDTLSCSRMMINTWRYERFFPDIKKSLNLYNFMLENYLSESDYTEVAVKKTDSGEEIVGFLFGQAKPLSFGKKMVRILFFCKAAINWLFGAYGNKKTTLDTLKIMKEDEEKMFFDITDKDAHMHLFFTSENARGLGIGKQLLSHFEEYCKKNDNERIMLITDTDCNYGFYDHIGFARIKEQLGTFGVPQTEEQKNATMTFIYAKKLKGK